jgi:hypothetical protein
VEHKNNSSVLIPKKGGLMRKLVFALFIVAISIASAGNFLVNGNFEQALTRSAGARAMIRMLITKPLPYPLMGT